MNWIKVLKIVGPAILAVVPGGLVLAPLVIAGIEVAEMTGKSSAVKKEIALNTVKAGVEAANIIAKKEVVNSIEAVMVANNTIDAIVGATNIATKITNAN